MVEQWTGNPKAARSIPVGRQLFSHCLLSSSRRSGDSSLGFRAIVAFRPDSTQTINKATLVTFTSLERAKRNVIKREGDIPFLGKCVRYNLTPVFLKLTLFKNTTQNIRKPRSYCKSLLEELVGGTELENCLD